MILVLSGCSCKPHCLNLCVSIDFSAAASCSVLQWYVVRFCLFNWFLHLYFSLNHQNDRFSCSVLKPVLSSCPLYADCRFVCYASSHQSLSQIYARSLVLTVSFSISTPHQGFTCVHLLNTHLTIL